VYSQTCRSTFLASFESPAYWPSVVPVAHLPRPAPWNRYSASELREAYVRYAASHRVWESPSPAFQRLPLPNCHDFYQRWRSIQGTRWAWSLHRITGEISFCDLRTGLDIGRWNAGGWVNDALIESRSPNHWVLCHWKTHSTYETSWCVPLVNHISPISRHPIGLTSKLWRHRSRWSKRAVPRQLRYPLAPYRESR
jgi:hypothetical protein